MSQKAISVRISDTPEIPVKVRYLVALHDMSAQKLVSNTEMSERCCTGAEMPTFTPYGTQNRVFSSILSEKVIKVPNFLYS